MSIEIKTSDSTPNISDDSASETAPVARDGSRFHPA